MKDQVNLIKNYIDQDDNSWNTVSKLISEKKEKKR